jgi:hypothetical protein
MGTHLTRVAGERDAILLAQARYADLLCIDAGGGRLQMHDGCLWRHHSLRSGCLGDRVLNHALSPWARVATQRLDSYLIILQTRQQQRHINASSAVLRETGATL